MPIRANIPAHKIGVVAETYAQALFELAHERGELETVEHELEQLLDLLRDQPELGRLFEHMTIDPQRREQSLRKIFSEQVSDTVLRFLLVLNEKGRLGELTAIAVAFDRRLKAHRGQEDVQVTTAHELSDEQLDQVSRRVSGAIGREAVLHPHVDASLIGGLKLRMRDKLIDASVAAQLRRLGRRLHDRGRQQLRGRLDELVEGNGQG